MAQVVSSPMVEGNIDKGLNSRITISIIQNIQLFLQAIFDFTITITIILLLYMYIFQKSYLSYLRNIH